MPRIRSVKPEFWSSETLAKVSRNSRLLFIGLWNFCDNYGVCYDMPRRILGDVFPCDEDVTVADVKAWIEELVAAGVLTRHRTQTRSLLIVTTWDEHQKVDHPGKSLILPKEEITEALAKVSRSPREDFTKPSRPDLGSRKGNNTPLPPMGAGVGTTNFIPPVASSARASALFAKFIAAMKANGGGINLNPARDRQAWDQLVGEDEPLALEIIEAIPKAACFQREDKSKIPGGAKLLRDRLWTITAEPDAQTVGAYD